MKVKTQWTSGPSHQTYANGKPCDRYIGTVHFTGAVYGSGWMHFTKQIVGKTEKSVRDELDKYQWESIIDIPESELDLNPILKKRGSTDADA